MHAVFDMDDTTDEPLAPLFSRRTALHRSLLGITGIGLAGILVACGDDDDDDDEPVVTGQGAEDPGEEPGIGEESGIGEDDEVEGTAEAVSSEEGLDDDDGD